MEPVAFVDRLSGMRTIAGIAVILTGLALGGCGTDSQASSQASEPVPVGVTDDEVSTAIAAARERLGEATLTSATVERGRNGVEQSNTGSNCESETVLQVRLFGTFPDVVVTGLPGESDPNVTFVDLTVDAETGETCLVSVGTGAATPDSGATRLLVDEINA